ncbi:MAG TPA: hypothetical protein VF743_01795 [Acidimicrobiales bacterium]
MSDRRAVFFLVAALLCAALVPVDEEHAWVSGTLAALYVVLALASWLDARSRHDS